MDRFEKIIVAASKQSRKIIFPKMVDLTTPLKYIRQKKYEQPSTEILCCHLDADSKPVFENYFPGKDVVLLIGPEGGFSHDEIEMMRGLNAKFVHLGPFRLRVENSCNCCLCPNPFDQ
jgi:16S rRNA (uracil1498-N3)-methyltransferase